MIIVCLLPTPDYDLATKYASAWSQEVIDIAERNGFQPIIIKGKSVTKSRIQTAIEQNAPKFIVFNGHGSETIMYVQAQH